MRVKIDYAVAFVIMLANLQCKVLKNKITCEKLVSVSSPLFVIVALSRMNDVRDGERTR